MGGGGHSITMLKRMTANRNALLSKRKTITKPELKFNQGKLKFKELSKESLEQEILKIQNTKRIENTKRKNNIYLIGFLIGLCSIIYLLIV